MRSATALALLLLAGCATAGAAPPSCPAGLSAATVAEAFFGRNAGGRDVVSDADWARFLDTSVTPAFPDGLSVIDAAGQWRSHDGRIERERSRVLLLVLPGATPAQAQARLAPVIAAYRTAFAQESVMLATSEACISF